MPSRSFALAAMTDFNSLPAAPLWRRLAALVYDGLLVGALWFVTAGLLVSLFNHLFPHLLVNHNGVGSPPDAFLRWVLGPLLLLEAWAFYAWFWLHGGQTLGMRSWRIQVAGYRGGSLRFWQTLARFGGAWLSALLMGVGYWLVLLPPYQSLHDRLSASATRQVPKDD